MKIQKIINGIFRQDFTDSLVLGRTLFALSILYLGFDNAIRPTVYASVAPSYVPFAELAAFFIGLTLVLSGFLILANFYLKKATNILVAIFSLFVFIVYLPEGNVLAISQAVGIIGGAILVRELCGNDVKEAEEKIK
jgi:uncharacterized membrane protein